MAYLEKKSVQSNWKMANLGKKHQSDLIEIWLIL